ncbi:hypothetical protein D1AOALGA4SA_2851 [Olavius algarvensis Delta 1 endosymbiont]|nr:hypothetical protein D1AOALGA4SA_2851 [Olavius algarvensis Delta 1 endosymbiont]
MNARMKLHWNDECRMSNDGFASLSLFKQTEYIIRCSMLDVQCSTFISFFSLIRLVARGQRLPLV